jgi:electron transport complex protein RnfG
MFKASYKLLIIAVIAAGVLGLVNHMAGPFIEANEREAKEIAMLQVLNGISDPVFSDEIETGNTQGVISYYIVSSNFIELLGYVVYVEVKGDQGNIVVCVGLNADGVVLGVKLVSHDETPGLGANAAKTNVFKPVQ